MTTPQDADRPIVIAAGGTGGHLFPAQALAQELGGRGHVIHLMTDSRVNRYSAAFPAAEIHEIRSATFGLREPLKILPSIMTLLQGYREARRIMIRLRACAAVGFGGYPTLPPLVAATRLGLPTCIHEQNAVIGRANRLLASRVNVVAGTFPDPKHLAPALAGKYRLTGNPVRQTAKAHAATPYRPRGDGEPFRVVVFGGSQGARVMSEIVPRAIYALAKTVKPEVVQQCREEDIEAVREVYQTSGVEAEIAPFFNDLPEKIGTSHLVICRAGASTIGELALIGRPAILVPLPHSLDQDQRENALRFVNSGGGWLVEQEAFTTDRLATMLTEISGDGQGLARRAAAALAFSRPDAEKALADVVEEMIARQ